MLNFNFKKISSKMTFFIVIINIVLFTMSTISIYFIEVNALEAEISGKLNNLIEMYALSIAEPMWDYDQEGITALGDSLFKDEEIIGIEAFDNISGIVYEKSLNDDENFSDLYIQEKVDVVYHEEVIGWISIVITKEYRLEKIYSRILLLLFQTTAMTLILIVVAFITSKFITRPLELLEEDARRLVNGEERARNIHKSRDEIGRLTYNFNIIADRIEKSRRELLDLNESLEMRVEDRTQELKASNEQLEVTLDELKETQDKLIEISKLKLTSKLVSGVAHQINTPLGVSITLSTYLRNEVLELLNLENKQNNARDIEDTFDRIELNLKKVSELVNTFKLLSFYDEGKHVHSSFLLCEHLKYILDNLRRNYDVSHIEINYDCDGDIVVPGQEDAYFQVFTQLLINAVDHAFNGRETGRIDIKCQLIDNDLEIIIKDDGIGIATSDLDEIFSPFFKKDSISKGAGLGLTIVQNIVTLNLNGQITCESSVENGTKFVVNVPI